MFGNGGKRVSKDAHGAEQQEGAAFKEAAFGGSSVAMMVVDRDFKVKFVNEATMRLMRDNSEAFRKLWPNFSAETIVGSCIDTFHKNPSHQRQMLSDPSRLPYRTDISVGDLKFALNVSAAFDAQRNYIGNVLEWDNVTAARLNSGMLAALHRSQAIIEFTLEGRVLNANENFLRALGYTLDEIRGQHHSMFCDADYRQTPDYRAFWERLGRGEFVADKFMRVAKGGREIWIQASYNPVLDASGRPFKVVKFASDITEAEVLSNEQRAKIEAMGRSQAVIEFKPDGTILHANENFLGAMGFPERDRQQTSLDVHRPRSGRVAGLSSLLGAPAPWRVRVGQVPSSRQGRS